jgi:hypothetical protein
MFAPALNAGKRTGAVGFSVTIRLASCALDYMVFLPGWFNSYLHIAEELQVVNALVIVLGLQVHKIKGQGFFCYSVADVKHVSNFVAKCLKFSLDFVRRNSVL